jgi:signal transduction histidine kinase
MELTSIAVKSILAFTVIIDALLILFIYTGKQKGILKALLLVHLLGIIGWAASILVVLQFEDILVARLSFVFALIFAIAKYYFVLVFPENRLPIRFWYYIPLIPASAALVLSCVPGMVFKTVEVIDGYYIGIDTGPFSAWYSIIVSFFLIYPIYALARKYFKGSYEIHVKEQLKYLCIGTALFFIISLATNSILPVFFNIYLFNGLGPAFSLILTSFIIFIISRHHFLGLKIIIQRGFIYSVLFFSIVSFYLAIINLTGILLGQITQTTIIFHAGLTTLLGIFTVPYIDRYLRRKTDRFFFKDTYNYADALYGLSEKINQSVLIEDIKDLTEKTLQSIMKTSIVTTSFVSRHQTSEVLEAIANHPNKTTLLVPIVFNETIIGTIFLGEKKSGDDYTHEDVVLIKTFSHQIALAFEKARLFKEVQEHSRELEQRVADRTHQIQKLQEQQTQMMLDISHKLQNPLTIVKTELELLRKQMPWKKEFAFFEKTIDDISLFIYDLLHLARFEAEEHHPKEQHDLSEHLLELLEYFETIAAQSSITLEAKIAPDVHFVYSKKEMTELLTNLVSNAIKYMGETNGRERRITVTLTEDSGTITLAVTDTGVGIDEKELPHIFERFYRAGAASATTIKGTGLGLAISKKIVEVHNGTISAQSAKGSGTTFTVVFQKN